MRNVRNRVYIPFITNMIDRFSLQISNFNRRDWIHLIDSGERASSEPIDENNLEEFRTEGARYDGIFRFCGIYLGCRDKTKIFRPCTRLQEHFINKLQPVKVAPTDYFA